MINSAKQTPAMKPSDLKYNNRIQILELFKSGDAWSASALADHIGISRQTVMKAIQFFIEKGIIVPDGKAESSSVGGKRAELFSLSATQYLFSLLICPDGLYISLFNYRCEIIDTYANTEIAHLSADEIINLSGTVCYKLLLNNNVPQRSLRGLCIATSGIVDHQTNVLKFNSLFPQWGRDFPVAEKLAGYFDNDVLVLVENVGKVCGSAFLHNPQFQDKRSLTVFSSWGGVCACLMERGRILNGKDALIGEIGHMMLEPSDPEICGCGSHGCFEQQVSNDRIRKVVRGLAEQYPDSVLNQIDLQDLTVQDVFIASKDGDQFAMRISEYLAQYFAIAMKNVTLLFNPDFVVFQGDYSDADDHFCQILERELNMFHYYNAHSPFSLHLDHRSIRELTTLGAYTLLIDRLFSDETIYS